MDKNIVALGLMSGTSMDGIDASIIRSDGDEYIDIIGNLYLKYDPELKKKIQEFTNKINSLEDLKSNVEEYKNLERKITIKHQEIISEIYKKFKIRANIIGFHGQTILHKPLQNFSIQMGNAELLSQLSKTDVVYQFRQNDIKNGGQGAPLTPIYHHNLKKKLNLKIPVLFLNIGGIANYTFSKNDYFCAKDAGPGNCLMDMYIKQKKNLDYDENGDRARSGKIDKTLISNMLDHYMYNSNQHHSLDIKDFDINFVKGLNTEDGLANLNYYSAKIIYENVTKDINDEFLIILCGGGRKNKTLISNLKSLFSNTIHDIDEFNIDGDFIESQAFAYLSIRSIYNKFISFPDTTMVKKSITGGVLIKSV
tara:strand:- start:456 stop:1553 length:1098 start_codon:yes stop_codon:yes gene_type:complete